MAVAEVMEEDAEDRTEKRWDNLLWRPLTGEAERRQVYSTCIVSKIFYIMCYESGYCQWRSQGGPWGAMGAMPPPNVW